jgi:hypothetical protein
MSLELLGLAGAAVLRLDGGGGLAVALDRASGQYNVTLDGVPWLLSTDTEPATYFGAAPALNSAVASGSELRMTWRDVAGAPLPWRTDIIAPADQPGSLIFRQTFTAGVANTSANVSAACGPVAEGTDQTGGTMIERFENVTRRRRRTRASSSPARAAPGRAPTAQSGAWRGAVAERRRTRCSPAFRPSAAAPPMRRSTTSGGAAASCRRGTGRTMWARTSAGGAATPS